MSRASPTAAGVSARADANPAEHPPAAAPASSALLAYAFLTASAFLWSTNSVAGRALIHDATPVTLAFWRWALALPILYPFVAKELRAHAGILKRDWKWFMLFGLLASAPNHVMVYESLQYTTAINVQLCNSTIPLWVMLIQWLGLSTRPRPAEVLGLLVSIVGVVVIVTGGEIARITTLDLNRGDLLILGCFITWSLYTVLLRFRAQELSASAFVFVASCCGLVIILPLFGLEMLTTSVVPSEPRFWGWVAVIVFGSSIFGSIFFSAGTDRVGAARSALFLHLIPVFGVALSILVLGERLQTFHGIGFSLVLAGLAIANRGRGAGAFR